VLRFLSAGSLGSFAAKSSSARRGERAAGLFSIHLFGVNVAVPKLERLAAFLEKRPPQWDGG
jgi:hypothetical protein